VYFEPLHADLSRIHETIERALEEPADTSQPAGAVVTIPVKYGAAEAPDLVEVAAWAGMTPDQVVAIHSAATYRVFMMGFVPGFPYLGTVDSRIAAPRRSTPRLRVEAGSVGIAGSQTGIYPTAIPGGWQIIGRTAVPLVDFSRRRPFLLNAGDTVRFEPVSKLVEGDLWNDSRTWSPAKAGPYKGPTGSHINVIKPGLMTTIQDRGRYGMQAYGVPAAGPMDPQSHRLANALLANPADAAVLEVTLVGPELEFEDERVVAVAGASFALLVDDQRRSADTPFVVPRGARLRFGERLAGARAYLAVEGGIDVAPVLGSRSTHLASGMGGMHGRAVATGDRLPLGPRHSADRGRRGGRRSAPTTPLPAVDAGGRGRARLRVLPGPDDDRFAARALGTLESSIYVVGSDSDRMGFRLAGGALQHSAGADIISEATPPGAVQVPASGQPVLLMADRQTTGGYPIIATVITADLPAAGQLAPGDTVTFAICTAREALAALIAQERAIMAIHGGA
jgi:KipI family sensor histidine kinase inhibitor